MARLHLCLQETVDLCESMAMTCIKFEDIEMADRNLWVMKIKQYLFVYIQPLWMICRLVSLCVDL